MPTVPSPLTPLLAIFVASCAGVTASPQPTEGLPDPPAGWSSIASDAGDVALLVPPDFEASFTAEGVLAQPPPQDGVTPLEIWAQAPASLPQPADGESLEDWLEEAGWVPTTGSGGVTAVADQTTREVLLASGRALEVATTAQPGTGEESRVVVYAVRTEGGIALIRFIGYPPQRMYDRADELEIVAQLARFGPGAGE